MGRAILGPLARGGSGGVDGTIKQPHAYMCMCGALFFAHYLFTIPIDMGGLRSERVPQGPPWRLDTQPSDSLYSSGRGDRARDQPPSLRAKF